MFEKFKLKRKIKQLQKRVDTGDTQAMYDLAMIYLDGTIIKKDENTAYYLLKKAADGGHLQSKTYLVTNKIMTGVVAGAKAISDIMDALK